jgi:S1-C subfamily serine protease
MNVRGPRDLSVLVVSAVLVAGLCAWPVTAAPPPAAQDAPPPARQRLTVDALSVVKVTSRAMRDARSSTRLGVHREGTGVVLDAKGLILTIGYLVLEAASIELSTADGQTVPGALVGYDHATGFALLRALGTLPVPPVRMGESASIQDGQPVLIVGYDGIARAQVVSRRRFAGYWEYLLDEAIYTAPATVGWAGAALLDREGRLLGIGSLLVKDATGPGNEVPGNLFVPIDLFKPLRADLVAKGRSSKPPRPWLGVQTQEILGNVIVTEVSPQGPADKAALRPGDVIVRVAGEAVRGQAAFYTRLWSTGPAGVEIKLEVLREGRIEPVAIKTIDRAAYYRSRQTL